MAKEPKDILEEGIISRLNGDNPSNRDIAEGVKYVIMKLWSEEQLHSIIDRRHKELCEHCPLRAVPVAVSEDASGAETGMHENGGDAEPVTRRHVMIEVIKAPWLWIVVATACAAICAKFGISLPMVGGGN